MGILGTGHALLHYHLHLTVIFSNLNLHNRKEFLIDQSVYLHALSDHFLYDRLLSYHTVSDHLLSDHALFDHALSAVSVHFLYDHALSSHLLSAHFLSAHSLSSYLLLEKIEPPLSCPKILEICELAPLTVPAFFSNFALLPPFFLDSQKTRPLPLCFFLS